MMKKLIPLILVTFIAGCAVGPNYQRPEIDEPANWQNADTSIYTADTTVSAADTSFLADTAAVKQETMWWQLFGDTILTNLITNSLAENYDIRIAAARVEELMGRYGVARSDFFPKINAGGTALRGQFGYPGLETDAERPTRNYFQVNLSADWEIDLWGKIRRANEAAKADLLASEEGRRGVVLSTISLIANAYIDLLALDRQLEIAESTAGVRRNALDLFRQRIEKGDLSYLEYSQAESEYWLAMAQIPVFKADIVFLENTINLLTGRNPGPLKRDRMLDSLSLPEIPVGMPSSLLERRPDVRFAEEQLRAANARIGVAKSLYFPSISLTGLFGSASNDLSTLFASNTGIWNIGGQVLQPVFYWGEIKGEVKAAEGIQKQALYKYVQVVRNSFREAEDALTSRSRTGEQAEAEAKRVDALLNYARLARMRYDEGVTSYLEVLDAERSLFDSQLVYAQTKSNLYKSVVAVYQALAGTWLDRAAMNSFQVEEEIELREAD
jgi:multidrug efflux system outer membrane protein